MWNRGRETFGRLNKNHVVEQIFFYKFFDNIMLPMKVYLVSADQISTTSAKLCYGTMHIQKITKVR